MRRLEQRLWVALPLDDICSHRLELFLEALAKDIDVKGSTVVDTPAKHNEKECCGSPSAKEPERAGEDSEHSVKVLDHHKRWLLQRGRAGEDKFANPGLGI